MNEYLGPFVALTAIGLVVVVVSLLANTLRGGIGDDPDRSEPGS